MVEKPFTPTSKEAHELIAIAKKHQRLLTVYQSKHVRSYKVAWELLISKKIEDGTSTSSPYPKWSRTTPLVASSNLRHTSIDTGLMLELDGKRDLRQVEG